MRDHIIQQALELYQSGQYEAAIGMFQQIDGADGVYGEADCLHRLARIEEAIEAVNRCLTLDPEHEDALALMEDMADGRVVDGDGNGDVAGPPAGVPPCLSEERNRPFVGVSTYQSEEELNTAMHVAREALAEVESAYRPASETSLSAVLALLIVTPFVLALLIAVCGGLCLAWAYLESRLYDSSSILYMAKPEMVIGWVSIILDGVVICLIAVVPGLIYLAVSQVTRNRRAWLPATLSAIVALLAAASLFLPVIDGLTLAPTEIIFVFIPIRWPLIVGAPLLTPIGAAAFARSLIAGHKFCEVTGRRLSTVRTLSLAFDYAENALQLLQQGDYDGVARLPRCSSDHSARIALWWDERAENAFLEMSAFFQSEVLSSTGEEATRYEDWLAFSEALDRTTAERLCDTYSE